MAKIRHIAYRAKDVDAMAKFFVDAMGMTLIQKRKNNAIDLSDGSVNITVLPLRAGTRDGEPTKQPGIDHIGFSAENDEEQFRMLEAAGARKAETLNLGTAYYEDKFVGPEGIVVDVGHWVGAAPVVGTEKEARGPKNGNPELVSENATATKS
jgi:catechol 2,3-dioxygenase-like lactoylglutathione lyase family enzyme